MYSRNGTWIWDWRKMFIRTAFHYKDMFTKTEKIRVYFQCTVVSEMLLVRHNVLFKWHSKSDSKCQLSLMSDEKGAPMIRLKLVRSTANSAFNFSIHLRSKCFIFFIETLFSFPICYLSYNCFKVWINLSKKLETIFIICVYKKVLGVGWGWCYESSCGK